MYQPGQPNKLKEVVVSASGTSMQGPREKSKVSHPMQHDGSSARLFVTAQYQQCAEETMSHVEGMLCVRYICALCLGEVCDTQGVLGPKHMKASSEVAHGHGRQAESPC